MTSVQDSGQATTGDGGWPETTAWRRCVASLATPQTQANLEDKTAM